MFLTLALGSQWVVFSPLGVIVNAGFPEATGVLTLGGLKVVVWAPMTPLPQG